MRRSAADHSIAEYHGLRCLSSGQLTGETEQPSSPNALTDLRTETRLQAPAAVAAAAAEATFRLNLSAEVSASNEF